MQRTWGYLAIGIAVVIGIAALLLPMPETVEIAPPLLEKKAAEHPTPLPASPKPRPKPAPPHKQAKAPPPPVVKTFPLQDTTKSRILIPQSKRK